MNAQAARLSNLDIDNAIKNDEFEVQFQPIFDLSNGALARLEAFVRWRHAALGVLPPGAFIPFFEAQGRMGELTRHILTSALAAYTDWRGPFPPGLSINLALSDLSDETFNDAFAAALADFEFAPSLVTLECPAPPINEDPRRVAERFARLRETGARLAIEVRGRTNDFLHHADPFPFQEIKTGGAAILRFARTVRGPGLSAISELLELADDKSAAITAVGVEDQASLTALRGLGFSAAQGNHLSPAGDLAAFRPSHVNTVREKMGLEALSKEALASMFKLATNGPDFGSIRGGRATTPAADRTVNRGAALKKAGESYDTLIDRLSERIETEGAASARAANLAKLKAMKRKRDEARRAAIPAAELAEMAAGRGGEADGDDADDRQARDLQSRLTEA
ncbi:MAG: EAL domain-containing protein, partial [Pseudomonadota bacterium]